MLNSQQPMYVMEDQCLFYPTFKKKSVIKLIIGEWASNCLRIQPLPVKYDQICIHFFKKYRLLTLVTLSFPPLPPSPPGWSA